MGKFAIFDTFAKAPIETAVDKFDFFDNFDRAAGPHDRQNRCYRH